MAKRKKQQTVGEYLKKTGQEQTVGKYLSDLEKQKQIRAKETERRVSEKNTKLWRDMSQDAKYSRDGFDRSYQVYAAKMMADKPGALKREQDKINKAISDRTGDWRNLTQNARYGSDGQDRSQIAYAAKQINDTRVSKEQQQRYGSEARAMKFNDFMNTQLGRQPAAGKAGNVQMIASGDELLNRYNQSVMNKYGSQLGTKADLTPAEQYAALKPEQKSGLYRGPQGNDVENILADDNARKYINTHPFNLKEAQANVAKYQGQVDMYGQQVDAYHNAAHQGVAEQFAQKPFNDMGSVFDYIENWDENNEQKILSRGRSILGSDRSIAERDAAGERMSALTGNKEKRRQEMLERAEDFFKNDYDPTVFSLENGDDPDTLRRALYDRIMPDGFDGRSYDERIQNMTADEKAELDSMLDAVLERASTESNYVPEEYENAYQKYLNQGDVLAAESRLRYSQDMLAKAQSNERMIQNYEHFMNDYGRPQAPNFVPENDRGGEAYRSVADYDRGVQTNDVHRIYSFINHGKEYQSWKAGTKNPYITEEYSRAGLMNAQEIAVFNDFYNQGKYDEASAFLAGLNEIGALSYRFKDYNSIMVQETAKQMPILTSIASQMMTMANTYMTPIREIAGALGDKTVKDPNSGWYRGAAQSSEIQNTIANELGGAAGKTYLNAMNSMRNVINGLMTRGLGFSGGMQTAASLAIFGSQIYQESTYKYLTETNDFDKARGLAALDTLMEVCEELLPYETMLSGFGGRPIMALFMNGASEMGEEVTGTTIGDKIKGIFTGRDSVQQRADHIFAEGGYYQDGNWIALDTTDEKKALNEADMQAIREKRQEILESAIGGGFGGTVGAAYSGITYKMDQYRTGSRINSTNNIEKGKTGAERILEMGSGMKTNTASYKLAQKIQEKINNGGKANNFELGQLAQNIHAETGEEMGRIAQETVEREARQQLMAKGVQQEDAAAAAKSIAQAVIDGSTKNMTEEAVNAITTVTEAVDLLKDFYSNPQARMGLQVKQLVNTEEQASVRQQVEDIASGKGTNRASARSGDVADAVKSAEVATEKEVRQAHGTSTGAANEVVFDNQIGTISRIENGEAVVTVNGEEHTASLNEIKAVNPTAAAVISLAKNKSHLMSDSYVNKVLELIGNNTKDAGQYLDDAVKIRLSVFGLNEMPRTGMDKKTMQALYQAAQEEYNQAEEQRTANAPITNKPGEGVASYNGAKYGTNAFTEAIKDLPAQVKDQVKALSEITIRTGHNVNYINDKSRSGVYGWYDHNTGTITINLAGEDTNALRHHIMVTAGHEMTHWLEQHSKEGYAQLRQFVVSKLRQQGINIEQRLVDTIDNFNAEMTRVAEETGEEVTDTLDLYGAMAEIVANSCDQVLGSRAIEQELAQVNPTLHGQIKDFVRRFVARLRTAAQGMKGSASYEARMLLNETEKIAEIWLGAQKEAGVTEDKITVPGVQFSTRQNQNIKERKQTIDLKDALKYPTKYNEYFTYDNLIKKDPIRMADLRKNNINTSGMDKSQERNAILDAGIKNARKIGKVKGQNTYVHVGDVGTNVSVSRRGLRHMYQDDENYKLIVEHVGEVLNQSVLINTAEGREDKQTGTYILLGAGINSAGKRVYAAFHVNRYTNEMEDVDVLYSIEERAAASLAQASAKRLSRTALQVNIADALKDVKKAYAHILPKNVVNRLGVQRRVNKDTQYLQHSVRQNGHKNIEGGSDYSTVDDIDKVERVSGTPSTSNIIQDDPLGVNSDKEYQTAVERGDIKAATDMLMKKLEKTEGITAIRTPHWDAGKSREIARLIKKGNTEAIAQAAAEMADMVPENAVLIPMPGRSGVVADDSWTMSLANAISELTGRPVVKALEGAEHESRMEAKQRGELGASQEELGFRKVLEIPDGTFPIFVDNVVGKGITADAARMAMGGGITLAYTKTLRSPGIKGLKNAVITYDKNGNLIPLSQRMDVNKRDVRYSVRQQDEEYIQAVNDGNVQRQQEMVYQAADEAMQGTKARYDDGELMTLYHYTNADFTEFHPELKGGDSNRRAEGFGIYLTDRKEIAERYGSREIKGYLNVKRLASGKKVTLKRSELINLIKAATEYHADDMELEYESLGEEWVREDLLRDSWISNYTETYWREKSMDQFYREVADQITKFNDSDQDIIQEIMTGMGIRDYWQAMDFYKKVLTPATGIDGIQTTWVNSDGELMGNILLAFDSSQIKLADPVTYDDDGKVIPLSERFNKEKMDIRYSLRSEGVKDDNGDVVADVLPGDTVAATQYSLRSWVEDKERDKVIKKLKQLGYDQKKIDKWMKDLDGIANKIATNRTMYDFVADRSKTFLKDNGDVYKKTLDASTMCKKTRLYNGTFNVVQHLMPHTILMPEDLIDLFNLMKENNLETPCGFCYVQSRRRHLGPYTEEWLAEYKGDYIPKVDEVTTSDGLEKLKTEHPQAYKDFVEAMNKKGVNNPKLVQQRTDYRGEIRDMRQSTVDYMKKIGGLRIQSFSDFEVVHMLDMMQAVMDMKIKGLTAQAYTKVPEFAWIFGKTGIKINLSLVGKGSGLDADGNLVFDNDEGINFDEAMKLREAYSKNVGTILVGINDDHIIAAMGDSRIDFIIPFHKSGWSENELKHMKGLDHYDDYTATQNEYNIVGKNADGTLITKKAESNIDPLSYWQFKKSGRENAEIYLKQCAEQKIIPKFSQFLVDNGDGTYSLPQGNDQKSTNIREGYWKTLIDFKMYDNEGKGSKQTQVEPNFNMEKAYEILGAYDGSHRQLPEDWETAQEFVRRYKEAHPLDDVRQQYSIAQENMDVNRWMLGMKPDAFTTEQEKNLWKQFKQLRFDVDVNRMAVTESQAKLKKLEAKQNPTAFDRREMMKLRNIISNHEAKLERLNEQIIRATSAEGYAGIMMKQQKLMNDLANGRTYDEVKATVDAITRELERITGEISERAANLEKLAAAEGVAVARTYFANAGIKKVAAKLKADMNSTMQNKDIESRLAMTALKLRKGENIIDDVSDLAGLLLERRKAAIESYVLSEVRGMTITLTEAQMKELKGQHRTLNDVRKELAGSGIRLKVGKGNTLDKNWDELCDRLPMLQRDISDLGMLDDLVRVVSSELQMVREAGWDGGMEQVAGLVMESVMELVDKAENVDKSSKEMLDFISSLSGEARESAKSMQDLTAAVERMKTKSAQARGAASVLDRDVGNAIKYFNALTEQSEAVIWRQDRARLIEQMKADSTKQLIQEQEKWKQKIERDKTARKMMQENLHLRKQITTNISRIRKLLVNETDVKNIPEHMKSLARYMTGLIVRNDLTNRKITGINKQDLMETERILSIMKQQDGMFTMDDLQLINDEEAQNVVAEALADLEDGIMFYNTSLGKDMISNLQAFKNSLTRIADAVSAITGVINAERSISFMDRKVPIEDAAADIRADMGRSRFKGELTGKGSKALTTAKRAVVYGNTTPVYFFKNLRNRGMSEQWHEMEQGENRSGLETQKAKNYLGTLAEKTGYRDWADEKHDVVLGGRKVKISINNMMELYAIWKREQTTNPEMSEHLTKGGVFIQEDEQDSREGKLRHERKQQRAIRVTDDEIQAIYNQMTDAQKAYMEGVVSYLSNEMSDLGNEASMRMYGIKKYKESYYFPMKVWDGVKSARSDKGITGTDENRAAHKSWSKRRQHMARNALVIGNFTDDAVKHIVEMINYNTMAPAIENINKILNYQFTEEGWNPDEATKRNMRVLFQEAYGKEALRYLEDLMKDMNGGLVQDQRKTLRDRALSMFKKNAVAGSASVALQQPLSIIRAAMMINPKYLAAALSPKYWKGSYAEMMKYSGVAVIKNMGRFDMNFGQSAKDYVKPDTKENAYEKVSNLLTAAPEMMDRMTWTRMWSAVKMEQHALHPELDMDSDAFMELVGKRFNEVMRRTQVYDSVLVKSSNMRSPNLGMKLLTSFMAEPTLSLNVLADAVNGVLAKDEKAGKTLATAGATFLLSAVMQAAVKGLMGSGRTPDDKKTWWENFLNKMQYSLMSEANPLNLIPGYNDVVKLLKTGELADDAMSTLGKLYSIVESANKAINDKGNGTWRDLEDTVGQFAQLFTNIPAKNLSRDVRAFRNIIAGDKYADRESSAAVIKHQAIANLMSADSMLGTINKWLGDAGYKTTNSAYYDRMYEAQNSGNEQQAEEIAEYLTLGRGVKPETINSQMKSRAKADANLMDAISSNKVAEIKAAVKQLTDNGYTKEQVKKQISTDWKQKYLVADQNEKVKIRNAIQIAYKQLGYTANDADKVINSWKPSKKKKE